jgi:hypothetical protein
MHEIQRVHDEINALSSRPMSGCLLLFIQSLLAEHYAEIAIEECLADDAIVKNAFAPRATWSSSESFVRRLDRPRMAVDRSSTVPRWKRSSSARQIFGLHNCAIR